MLLAMGFFIKLFGFFFLMFLMEGIATSSNSSSSSYFFFYPVLVCMLWIFLFLVLLMQSIDTRGCYAGFTEVFMVLVFFLFFLVIRVIN
ncbi:hypothetical protein N619_00360 [Ectopseudomonas oleovorans]|nr:hypothetical protein N619_00360 [Pseudomonas oleovorans]